MLTGGSLGNRNKIIISTTENSHAKFCLSYFFLYRNGAVTYQIILSFFPSALLQLHFLIYDQNWSWMFLFPSERLNNVEPQKMVKSKSIRVPRERLLRPWFHSPLSRYQSSLMSRKTWYIHGLSHGWFILFTLCVVIILHTSNTKMK